MDKYTYILTIRNVCYIAKTCIHNGDEKCGEDSNGQVRRFYDTCDLLEFNCLYGTNFTKTTERRCRYLPPIDAEEKANKTEKQKP